MEGDMSHSAKTDRTAIARAACDVSGLPFVDLGSVPMKDRAYFFAVPDGTGSPFGVEKLTARLAELDVVVDSDRDHRSEHFGLRFVHKSMPVPKELKPFQTAEARENWAAWRKTQVDAERMTSALAVGVAETSPDLDADTALRRAARSSISASKKAVAR